MYWYHLSKQDAGRMFSWLLHCDGALGGVLPESHSYGFRVHVAWIFYKSNLYLLHTATIIPIH